MMKDDILLDDHFEVVSNSFTTKSYVNTELSTLLGMVNVKFLL